MASKSINPTVTVPVAAVSLINRAVELLGMGDDLIVSVLDQEIDGIGYLDNAWVYFQGDLCVPQPLRDRLWAAAEEINAVIADNPIVGVRGGYGEPLELFIRTE